MRSAQASHRPAQTAEHTSAPKLRGHNALLLSLLALGFALRVWNAGYRFLNADEILHYLLSVQPSLAAAYKASFATVHPPLLIVFLHYWGMLGHSELFLRLPSVVAGTAFCWIIFCWLRRVTNYPTALIAFALLLFSPPLIQLSVEVRQYAFLLLFCAASVYFLDRAIAENSTRSMLFSLCAFYLATLTHYSALIFAFTIGIYAALRIAAARPRFLVITTWIAGQLGAAALIAVLYFTHITKVRARHAMEGILDSYLLRSVRQPGQNWLAFIARSNLRLFHYFFSQGAIGALALVLFICGVVILFRNRSKPRPAGSPSSRQLAFLMIFPLGVNCILALFRAYPYGGTRHDAYLAIFVIPGIAVALARWNPRQHWLKPTFIAAVLVLCNLFPNAQDEYIPARDQSRSVMSQSVTSLRSLPPGSIIFTDHQGGLLLSYYLCGKTAVQLEQTPLLPLFSAPCGNSSVISLDAKRWSFNPETVPEALTNLENTFNLRPGAPLWLFQFIDHAAPRGADIKPRECMNSLLFGRNISVCQIRLP